MIVKQHAAVHPSVRGEGAIFEGARADAGVKIGKSAWLLPGCHVESGATVGWGSYVGRGAIVKRGSHVPANAIVPDGAVYPGPLFSLSAKRYNAIWEAAGEIIDDLAEQPGPFQEEAQRLSLEACGMSPGRLLPWVGAIAELYEAYLAEMRKGFTPEQWAREVARAQAKFDREEAAIALAESACPC